MELQSSDLFEGLSPDVLLRIMRIARVRQFSQGETIFHEDDPAENIHILRDGEVELTYTLPQDPTTEIGITHIHPGETFAWSALAMGRTLSSHARALVDSNLYVIPAAALHAIFREDPEAGYTVMTRLAGQILNRLRETRKELRWLHQGAR